jgi:hypothetical protein
MQVRQGYPLSPLLFDIMGDGLAMMMKKAQEEEIVTGLVPHLVDGGVSVLQYAYENILLLEDQLTNARNVKFILCLFEQILGLKINFHKRRYIAWVQLKNKAYQYSEIFSCPTVELLMKYLGMPIGEKKLAASQWDPLEEKSSKKGSWMEGKHALHWG